MTVYSVCFYAVVIVMHTTNKKKQANRKIKHIHINILGIIASEKRKSGGCWTLIELCKNKRKAAQK